MIEYNYTTLKPVYLSEDSMKTTDEEKKLINPCDAKTAYEATIQTLKMVKCEVEKMPIPSPVSNLFLFASGRREGFIKCLNCILSLLDEMIGEDHG